MNTSTPAGRKRLALMLALLVAVMPFSIDAYLPAMPQMAAALGADIHQIEQSLSVFLLGWRWGNWWAGRCRI